MTAHRPRGRRRTATRRPVLLIVAAATLTACSTGSPSTAPASPAQGPGASSGHAQLPPPEPAAALASQVPGCSPAPLGTADASSPGLAAIPSLLRDASSAATCTLRGRTAAILTFARARDQSRAAALLRRVDAYYAGGRNWLAAPEQTAASAGEQSVVQDVALALRGTVSQGSPR